MEDNINYVDKYVEVISLINETQKYRFFICSFPSHYLFIYIAFRYVTQQSQALGLADIFEVPHSAIHIGRMLGEGAFGRVHEATAINLRRMRGTTIVAVKQLKCKCL